MLVIDGHNLIPKIPGWSLREMDDEARLIELLLQYTRVKRKALQVFFDGAPPGQAGTRPHGMVTAHFVQAGRTADEAIRLYLIGLKKGAKNVTVVTSDRMVQANARALGASVLPSEDFARDLVDLKAGLDFAAAKARGRGRGAAATGGGAKAGGAKSGGAKGGGAKAGGDSEGPASPQPSTGRGLNEWYDLFDIDPEQAEKPIELKPPPKPKPAQKAPAASRGTTPGRGAAPRKHHGFPKKKDG